jgi:alkanesulfonate monooxygenase SsuD/methylene tetrahydromethanopterin reductase-like flavin-dependent oxidoreductase (luciferase family)
MNSYATRPAYRRLFERGGVRGPVDLLVAGSIDQVVEELLRFRVAGVDEIIIEPIIDDPADGWGWIEDAFPVLRDSLL